MGYRRRAGGGRRDLAEKAILEALRDVGAECWQVGGQGNPDLLVLFQGVYYAAEVKTGAGKETKNQGAFPLWRTVEDALAAIGIRGVLTDEAMKRSAARMMDIHRHSIEKLGDR